MTREKKLHRNLTLGAARPALASPSSSPSIVSSHEQHSTLQYSADLDPDYFRSLISRLHRTGAPLLPSPIHPSRTWSSSHHSNFTLFSFQFTSLSHLLPFIQTQFSFLVYFYLLLICLWTNLVFLFKLIFTSRSAANQAVIADAVVLHQLEAAFFLEPTNGVDRVSERLWRDDETVKSYS
jgi:hypothetical protein